MLKCFSCYWRFYKFLDNDDDKIVKIDIIDIQEVISYSVARALIGKAVIE